MASATFPRGNSNHITHSESNSLWTHSLIVCLQIEIRVGLSSLLALTDQTPVAENVTRVYDMRLRAQRTDVCSFCEMK